MARVDSSFLRRRPLLPTLKSLSAAFVVGISIADAASPPQAAVWMQHMVEVKLHDLPKNYSCYDLWYRFREVLEKIGARPDWKITTQGCVFSGDTQTRSPQVELEFYFPEGLPPAQAKWSDVKATRNTVVLEAGTAANSLDKSDCVLVRQIKDGLLPALPVQVLDARVDCASAGAKHPYRISVQTLIPVPAPGGVPASASSPATATH
jgi:hypothetical protein